MSTDRKTLRHPFATATALLGGIRRRDSLYSLASVHCFAREDRKKLAPARVMDRLVEARFAVRSIREIAPVPVWYRLGAGAQVLALDGLVIDGVVLAHQGEGRLMVEVQPLAADFLVAFGEHLHGFAQPITALLAAANAPLGTLQRLLCLAVMAWVLDEGTIRQRQKRLQAHVNAGFKASSRQGLHGHIRTGEAGLPAIGFPGNRHRFRRALYQAMEPDSDSANLGQEEAPSIQARPIPIFAIGKTMVATAALQARIARLFVSLHAPKERLHGFIQPAYYVLQHMGMDVWILWSHFFEGWQLILLVIVGEGDLLHPPRFFAFLQCRVIQFPAPPEGPVQLFLLLWRGVQLVLETFTAGISHVWLSVLPDAGSPQQQPIIPLPGSDDAALPGRVVAPLRQRAGERSCSFRLVPLVSCNDYTIDQARHQACLAAAHP